MDYTTTDELTALATQLDGFLAEAPSEHPVAKALKASSDVLTRASYTVADLERQLADAHAAVAALRAQPVEAPTVEAAPTHMSDEDLERRIAAHVAALLPTLRADIAAAPPAVVAPTAVPETPPAPAEAQSTPPVAAPVETPSVSDAPQPAWALDTSAASSAPVPSASAASAPAADVPPTPPADPSPVAPTMPDAPQPAWAMDVPGAAPAPSAPAAPAPSAPVADAPVVERAPLSPFASPATPQASMPSGPVDRSGFAPRAQSVDAPAAVSLGTVLESGAPAAEASESYDTFLGSGASTATLIAPAPAPAPAPALVTAPAPAEAEPPALPEDFFASLAASPVATPAPTLGATREFDGVEPVLPPWAQP